MCDKTNNLIADKSNGYEAVASEFIALRGNRTSRVGVDAVRTWAKTLTYGSAVIDLGCGPGIPLTETLIAAGLNVFGFDPAPSFVRAFKRNLPDTPVACETVQESGFFGRTFDGVLAWGLIFLLSLEDQLRLLERIAQILKPGGKLLFTSPQEAVRWTDAMTGLESRSLGSEEYRRQLSVLGISLLHEYDDEGQNHYFEAVKAI